MAKQRTPFPEWYRANRPLLGAIANFWLLPRKFKVALNAVLVAFDAWLFHPTGSYAVSVSDPKLSQIIIHEEG